MHKRRAGFWLQGNTTSGCICTEPGNPLERSIGAVQNESRHAEALAFKGIRPEILGVRPRLSHGWRSGGARILWIFAGHYAKRDRGVGHIARDGTGVVE